MGLDPTLPALNQTWLSLGPGAFVLLGESGMDALHAWLSAPVCLLYLATLVGNTLLLGLAAADKALQRPMYQLLGLLTASDLVLATSTVPKALAVRRGLSGEISFQACLAQLFVAHVAFIAESSVLWAMAVDCYMAMCRPLRYGALRAQCVVGIVAVAAVTRGACVMAPPVALLRRLPYCGQRALPHTYCEHLGAARLAWSYTRPTVWYGLATTLLSPRPAQGPGHLRGPASVITLFCTPALFFLAHRFGRHTVPGHVHIFLSNPYVVVPPALNPVVYGVQTQQIAQRLRRLFRLCWAGPARGVGPGRASPRIK
ncbi:hypothetical protein CapIbe_013014 [Capra ibex]